MSKKIIVLFASVKLQLFLITVVTLLVYSNTLNNGFTIDDHLFVVDWQITKSLSNLPKMFVSEFAPGLGEHNGVYRPIRTVFYALSYQIWRLNPIGYHLQAVLVHLTTTLLIYGIACIVFKELERKKSSNIPNTKYSLRPFLTALLFGLHPIHTEPVNYITASFDMIGEMFFFASFYLYLKARQSILRVSIYAVSIIFAFLAFFTDEITLTLVLLLPFYDFLLKQIFKKISITKLLKNYIPYFSAGLIYLYIRVVILHIASRGDYLGGSFYLTQLTMTKAFLKYIALLVWPLNLSINPVIDQGIYSWVGPLSRMDKILSQKITDPLILLSIFLIITLITVAVKTREKIPLITFSIGWFFISLIPVSYVIAQGPIMQERYAYIASFGFSVLFVTLSSKLHPKSMFFLVILLVSILFFVRTYTRNFDWKDGSTVWLKLVEQIPDDTYANFIAGNIYEQGQKFAIAASYYQKTTVLSSEFDVGYFKLGSVYQKMGDRKDALQAYRKALSLYPSFTLAKETLDNLVQIAEDDSFEISRKDGIWVSFNTKIGRQKIMFLYPKSWQLTYYNETIILKGEILKAQIQPDQQGRVAVQILVSTQNPEELNKFNESLGSMRVKNLP